MGTWWLEFHLGRGDFHFPECTSLPSLGQLSVHVHTPFRSESQDRSKSVTVLLSVCIYVSVYIVALVKAFNWPPSLSLSLA